MVFSRTSAARWPTLKMAGNMNCLNSLKSWVKDCFMYNPLFMFLFGTLSFWYLNAMPRRSLKVEGTNSFVCAVEAMARQKSVGTVTVQERADTTTKIWLRFSNTNVLYFGWPNQPSSGTTRVDTGLLLCICAGIYSGFMLTYCKELTEIKYVSSRIFRPLDQ